jgi:hypothetical protein
MMRAVDEAGRLFPFERVTAPACQSRAQVRALTLNDRVKRMLPRALHATRRDVVPLLLPCVSPLRRARRRGDCAELGKCEDVWFAWHGEAQAQRPKACSAFRPIARAA